VTWGLPWFGKFSMWQKKKKKTKKQSSLINRCQIFAQSCKWEKNKASKSLSMCVTYTHIPLLNLFKWKGKCFCECTFSYVRLDLWSKTLGYE
jgi:hypothetical protein